MVTKVQCTVDVVVEYNEEDGVSHVMVALPPLAEYNHVSGPELSAEARVAVADWSWHDFEFVSNTARDNTFRVVCEDCESGDGLAVDVVTDTANQALAKAEAMMQVEHGRDVKGLAAALLAPGPSAAEPFTALTAAAA